MKWIAARLRSNNKAPAAAEALTCAGGYTMAGSRQKER